MNAVGVQLHPPKRYKNVGTYTMKFSVDRDVLADAVTWTARTLPSRPPSPVLAGVRIVAEPGQVRLSSFDYEVSAQQEFAAQVETPGIVLVLGKLLADIARSLPNAPVDFELQDRTLHVVCGPARFALQTMPVDEYPTLPALPALAGSVDSDELAQAVGQVAVAASRDETLPLLTGIRMEISGSTISLLSTDRYRLALRELAWTPSSESMNTVALVKAKTLTDFTKTLSSGAGQVEVHLADEQAAGLIGFSTGGRQTTSQLVDGDYPEVRRLFPESSPIYATVRTGGLIEAVKRVALVAERNTPIRLAFTEGQVVLDAGQGDDAQASETLMASLVGEDITVAFNPQFLIDGLTALSAEFVRMSFTHPTKPVEFTGQDTLTGEDSHQFRYLLVPIRYAG